jgi:hexosaminidase
MRTFWCVAILCFLALPAAAQSGAQFNVMPMTRVMRPGTGTLPITGSFSVAADGYKEPRLDRAVQRFLNDLSRETGMPVRSQFAGNATATLVIRVDHASKPVQELGEDESYVLDVTPSGATLAAANPLGAMHGLETFLQLVEITPTGFAAPAVHIEDSPRFPWRGLSIDVSRHFISLEVLKRNIDAMAAVKMNVLHLHLSDDQGFRVESKKFPRLTQMGSDDLYYTQAEIRDLVAYARDRGIRVVPEFDMPGHSTSWFVGYPELASAPGPYQIERGWGIFNPAMDPTREETYKFLDKFIGEMAGLFPDAYFHIGGDEVNGKQWDANPQIQQFMRAHNLKTNKNLQKYFTLRVQKIVAKHRKTMIGWDEILSPGMPDDVVIQSWRGQDSLAAAAKQGYSGILSSGYYLDAMSTVKQYYSVDPMANADAALTPDQQKRILGGEACMWAEFVTDENIESRIWPRAAVVAERLWSPAQVQDVDSMCVRLNALDQQLDELGLRNGANMELMLERMAGANDIAALRVLADVAEPLNLHLREQEAKKISVLPTSETPLNRMVDAVAPESEVARQFSDDVNQFIASKFQDSTAEVEIRARLVSWRDNDVKLQPSLRNSYLLEELSPVSQNLSSLGGAGLAALDFMDKGEQPADSWRDQQLAIIQQASQPAADVTLAIAPAIQQLVEASATGKK